MPWLDGFVDTMPEISVIIPIYKVERFIERCARSLFGQTMQEGVEFIFVDDATPDNSIDILQRVLEEYPMRKKQSRILRNKVNKGLPASRNVGLSVAKGEYIFHCDSDDFVEFDMLASFYEYAKMNDADIVWCDWYLSFSQNERYMKQPDYETSLDALKAMLSGAMKYNVWNKFVRRTLYTENGISFPDGYGMGEDMTMMMLFACAQKVAYLPKAYYHYVKLNVGSFSQVHSMIHFEALKQNVQRVVTYLEAKYGHSLDKEIAFLKLEAKFPFLIMADDKSLYNLWETWYPEANKYICQNKNISFRNRALQWFAWKRQFWVVRLYYYVIIRFVYGVIYR